MCALLLTEWYWKGEAMRRIFLALALLISNPFPALPQTVCPPEKLAAAIDTYTSAPFSARTWRVLNGLGDPGVEPEGAYFGDYAATEEWRRRATELAPELTELQQPGYDCRMGYPLSVLNERVSKLGGKSPYIKQWLLSQQRVLQVCSDPAAPNVSLPVALEVTGELQTLQADDRAYQNASIAFYTDKQKAAQLFKAIGASQSVHKGAARYTFANILANAKDIAEAKAEAAAILSDPSIKAVHKITEDLLGYIANIEDTPEGWTRIINRALRDATMPLDKIRASSESRIAYKAALYDLDYAGIGDKESDWWIAGKLPEDPTISKAIVDVARRSQMALWMMTGQSVHQKAAVPWTYQGEKWNAAATSYIDRARALQPANAVTGLSRVVLDAFRAKPDDAARAALWYKAKAAVESAVKSCGEAPETAAAGFLLQQAVRLSAISGNFDEAYHGLAAIPFKGSGYFQRDVVFKLGQYLLASGQAEETRRFRDIVLTHDYFADLKPDEVKASRSFFANMLSWIAEDEARWRSAQEWSDDKLANPVINLLPAAKLRELADDPMFSPAQKALLTRAAWTRNYAAAVSQKPDRFEEMLAANSELRTAYDKVQADYPTISKRNRLLLTILRNPRFGILANAPDGYGEPIEASRESYASLDEYDPNDKNWWCPLQPDRHLGLVKSSLTSIMGGEVYLGSTPDPFFDYTVNDRLSAAREALLKQHPIVRQIDWTEIDKLASAPSAPKLLAERAIAWANASKGEDGAPEALALAVRTTRFGCRWAGGHKAYSKPAQELLKAKFGSTEWAASTPYWFDCVDQEWGADYTRVASCKPRSWPKQIRP